MAPNSPRRLIIKAAQDIFICLLVVAAGVVPAFAGQPMIGTEAPGFTLPTLAGATVSLADLSGKFVVLHFGAGW